MLDSSPYPLWLYGLLAAGCVALVVGARRLAISDRLRRWSIFIPRILVLGLLLLVLLNPAHRQEHHLPSQPSQVHYLIDSSRSMSLEEPITRATAVQQAIGDADRRLPADKRPRLQMFKFGNSLAALPDLGQLGPTDDASRLSMALEQLPARFSREPPRAVVVFSDGAIDDGDRLATTADVLKRLNIPVHVYPIGNPQVRGDVGIDDLVVPRRVDAGVKAPIRGVVRAAGYPGERVVLSVRPVDRPFAEPMATLPLTLSDGETPFEMVVEANPEFGELLLEVPPLPGEVTLRNNQVPFQLGTQKRKLRVLYMEGTGGTEYRWVRDALQEDKEIECVAMIADQQYVQRPRLMRIDDVNRGFPTTKEELFQYDVVICSDIVLGAYTKEQLDWVVELVSERGGGFVMVGGITSFGAGGWDQTVWDQLIPVDMSGGNLGRGWLYHNFRVSVPAKELNHPIWRIVDDPDQNQRAIAAMPYFYGTNYIKRLKPAATALAYSVGPIPNLNEVMPVFASQPYGKGRTFAFSPDTTADWGRDFESRWGENDNRYFRRFWRNLVRWLAENSVAGTRRVLIETDKLLYRAGEPIHLTAKAYTEMYDETVDYELRAEVKLPAAAAGTLAATAITLSPDASGKGYVAELDSDALASIVDLGAGESAALPTRLIEVIATYKGKEIGRTTTKIQILPDLHELLRPQPRPEILRELAAQTGGKELHSGRELAEVLKQLPEIEGESLVSRQPLWDRPWLWGAIVGLLVIEWILRRLSGFG